MEFYLLLDSLHTMAPCLRVECAPGGVDGVDELFPTESVLRQQVVVSFSRHGVETLLGYLTENIHCESVWDCQLRLLVEVILVSDGKHPDRVMLEERRRSEEFPKSCCDSFCRVFVCNPEEVFHQTQIFDNGGVDRIDELEKGLEDVG